MVMYRHFQSELALNWSKDTSESPNLLPQFHALEMKEGRIAIVFRLSIVSVSTSPLPTSRGQLGWGFLLLVGIVAQEQELNLTRLCIRFSHVRLYTYVFVIFSSERERGAPLVLRAPPPRPRAAAKRSPPPWREDLIFSS